MLLALLSGITALIGVGLALWLGSSAKGIATGMGFSAGIMILISAVELIPESVSEAGLPGTFVTVALGAGIVASLHVIIPHTHLIEERGMLDARLLRGAYLVAFGLILHDFPEGFAMANSYVASPSLGILVALAIALHNIPEEFAMAAPAVTLRKRLQAAAPASHRLLCLVLVNRGRSREGPIEGTAQPPGGSGEASTESMREPTFLARRHCCHQNAVAFLARLAGPEGVLPADDDPPLRASSAWLPPFCAHSQVSWRSMSTGLSRAAQGAYRLRAPTVRAQSGSSRGARFRPRRIRSG